MMYEQKSARETIESLQCETWRGMTDEKVAERQKEYGKNELAEEKKKTSVAMFLEQLNDPLIFVLFMAAAISMLLQEFSDTVIIVAVILLNSVVGVIQEGRAQKALDALKKLTSPIAVVRRNGRQEEIPAADLVPGDIVLLEAGRQVPADLRLIQSSSLKIEEASLSGESNPVDKNEKFVAKADTPLGDRINMAFMSTNVVYGRGEGIVTATGMDTEIGKIAGLINEVKGEATPLQKRLGDLGKMLSIVAVVLCVILFGIAVWQQRDVLEMMITAISLAVAAVPEGLPAVVTIVLALSVSRMVKVNTIVRRLPSVETLGAVSVVCSDKTGTLTQNKMSVVRVFTDQRMKEMNGLEKDKHIELIRGLMLCNDASAEDGTRIGDPTELALLDMGAALHINKAEIEKGYPRVKEQPFDSERKMMTTMHRHKTSAVSYTKGAPDEILKRCSYIYINGKTMPMTIQHRKDIRRAVSKMSADALRVLALAMCRDVRVPQEQEMIFVGMVGMIDPVRPEVGDAVKVFRKAKVKTVMITGDHIDTAFAIARDIGIASDPSQCITGADFEQLSEIQIQKRLDDLTVFARVSPEHKVKIVKAFKEQGNIVAMTGDGVNDAPSLKSADIGIAMGKNGTDVAKNAADIILTDDNFATIKKAIEEGRGIYENIKKSVLFLLSSNFGEIITMFTSILVGFASPLKASHILWVNLITDSLPALGLGVDENDKEMLMEKPPRRADESLFANGGLFCTIFYGAVIAAISLTAFLMLPYRIIIENGMELTRSNLAVVLSAPYVLTRAQTYAFTVLGVSQLFHAIGMRNVEKSVFRMNHLSNRMMIAAVVIGLGLQVAVTEIPYLVAMFGTARLSAGEWRQLLVLASVPMIIHELLLFHPLKLLSGLFGAKEKLALQEQED